MAFVANMADKALTHAAKTPNVPLPSGGMSHDKMLAFLQQMTQKGIQSLDAGGTALAPPTVSGPQQNVAGQSFTGAIGNFLGTNNQYQAQGAPIQAGTNAAQLNNAYTGAQGALNTQGELATGLNNGLNQGNQVQQTLSNQYQQQVLGGGPNPALASLNQQTGNNIAQQAALAAGQRGGGANVGLLARENAQQGAATEQQAVGQAATMQAEQQLAAEQNLQNLSANQIAQGQGATQVLDNAQQNEQNILQGANTAANNANVSQQSNINNVNAGISQANAGSNSNIISGIGNALSNIPVIGSFLAEGGEVKKDKAQVGHMPWFKTPMRMAEGGIAGQQTSAPQSYVGNWLNSNVDTQGPGMQPMSNMNLESANPLSSIKAQGKAAPAKNLDDGQPNQFTSADAAYTEGSGMDMAGDSNASGYQAMNTAYKGGLMTKGGPVKAQNSSQKAVKKGDSLENDKVPALLSEGEVVMDRKTLSDPGTIGQMARAVAMHIQKRNKGSKNG